jgi:hypothetical protein
MLTGYPLGIQMPGRPGLGGYWGVSIVFPWIARLFLVVS